MDYRWLTDDEILEKVNPVHARYGWAELNTATSKVLGAFDGDNLVETIALQLYPTVGPLVRHDNTLRDNGETSRELALRMKQFLEESNARGYLTIAESPATERICRRHGMRQVECPVFIVP